MEWDRALEEPHDLSCDRAGDARDLEQLLVGGVKNVAEQLRGYCALGFEYVMVRHIIGEHDAMLRSFERIDQSLVAEIRDP